MTSIVVPEVPKKLNEPSARYFRETREYWYQKKLSEVTPPGPVRDQAWEQVRKGLTLVAGFYEKNNGSNGGKPLYFIGNTFTYADIVIGSFLHWPKAILDTQDFDWDDLRSADGGLWGRIADEIDKYRQVL